MDFTHLLADRTQNMGASVIREILKVVSQPGMISLAGGILGSVRDGVRV